MNDFQAFPKNIIRTSAVYSLITIFALLLLSACSFSLAEDITPPPGAEIPAALPTQPLAEGPLYPMVHPDPSAGAQIYAEKCAPCHGSDGLGNGEMADQLPFPPPAIGTADLARSSSPAEWYAIVTNGNMERRMPPFNSLTDRQRWDVTAYLYTLSSNTDTVLMGEEVYQSMCASCHGEAGSGDGSEAAALSVPPTNFTDQEFMANVTNEQLFQAISEGEGTAMPAYGEQLSPDERWALTAYLRSLTFLSPVAENPDLGTPEPTEGTSAQIPSTPLATEEVSGMGVVEGQVISVSGGEIPANLTVALHGFDQMQQSFFAEIEAGADGEFKFENVDMPKGRAFLASVTYQDMGYSSDIVVVDENSTNLALVIPYYETTTDTSILSVDRLHFLFSYLDPDMLRVVEMYIISNPGNEIVVAPEDGEPVLSFSLPEGATNLQFEDGVLGDRYIQTENGFGDAAAIRPGMGQHQVVYSYDVPYKSKLEFERSLDIPVDAVVVLLPEDGLKVKGEQLQDMGTRDVQGIAYKLYSSGRLAAGTNLALDISGRPNGGGLGLALGSNTNLVVGLVAFGVVLIVAGVWLYSRTRKEMPEESEFDDDNEYSPAEDGEDLDVLYDAILALDDQYKAGELPEGAYHERRNELKARIKEIMRSQEAGEPGSLGAGEPES